MGGENPEARGSKEERDVARKKTTTTRIESE
jgi:hypothetical protein